MHCHESSRSPGTRAQIIHLSCSDGNLLKTRKWKCVTRVTNSLCRRGSGLCLFISLFYTVLPYETIPFYRQIALMRLIGSPPVSSLFISPNATLNQLFLTCSPFRCIPHQLFSHFHITHLLYSISFSLLHHNAILCSAKLQSSTRIRNFRFAAPFQYLLHDSPTTYNPLTTRLYPTKPTCPSKMNTTSIRQTFSCLATTEKN